MQIARARVEALETTVKSESATAQVSSVAGATLKQLTNDLEAKRSLYVSFLTQASQMRIAVMQQPTAQQLFQGLPPERPAHAFGAISVMLGFVAGVVGAASTVLFRATMADKISSRFEVAKVTGLTVFGSLPEVRTRDGNISTPRQTASLITETFRAMWLTMRPEPGHGTTILITSAKWARERQRLLAPWRGGSPMMVIVSCWSMLTCAVIAYRQRSDCAATIRNAVWKR